MRLTDGHERGRGVPVALTLRRPAHRLAYVLWYIPYIGVYQITNRFPLFDPRELHYGALDSAIPYWPSLMPVYLLYLPLFWWTGARSRSDEEFTRFVLATHFQLAICAVVFLLWPVRMPDSITANLPASGWATGFWHWFDGPNNCFPSLHAANGLLFVHFNWKRTARWFHTVLGAGVVLSTVLVKQHYVVDVFAGAGVYLFTALLLRAVRIHPIEEFIDSGAVPSAEPSSSSDGMKPSAPGTK